MSNGPSWLGPGRSAADVARREHQEAIVVHHNAVFELCVAGETLMQARISANTPLRVVEVAIVDCRIALDAVEASFAKVVSTRARVVQAIAQQERR